jgi:hypothetical protein
MMDIVYRTASIKPEMREHIPNATHQFDVCEDCGNANYDVYTNLKFYSRYKLVLCDACVDCRDGHKWRNKADYSHRRGR